MCPSYMVTQDEAHSTRGRANVLRLAMTGRMGEAGLADEGVHEVLDLCLECRACKSECPVGVDVAKFKSEFLAGYWERHGLSASAQIFGHARAAAEWGSRLAPLSNAIAGSAPAKWLAESGLRHRSPARAAAVHAAHAAQAAGRPALGGRGAQGGAVRRHVHRVRGSGDRHRRHRRARGRRAWAARLAPNVCCGRPLISQGLLREARKQAAANVHALYDLAAARHRDRVRRAQLPVGGARGCARVAARRAAAPRPGGRRRVGAVRGVSRAGAGRRTGAAAAQQRAGTGAAPSSLPSALDGTGRAGQGAAVAHSRRAGHRPRGRVLRHGRLVRLHARPLRGVAGHRRAQAAAGRARPGRSTRPSSPAARRAGTR